MPSLRARLTNALLRLTTKPLWKPGLDIGAVRRHASRVDARIGRRALGAPVEDVEIAGVHATWIGEAALAERKGTLLYLHGGAWCVHLPKAYRRFAAALSGITGMRVLLVDYRLAPEHPHPAASDDCLAVYRALTERDDARPSVVAGDSAGGNLALVTLMRARETGLPLPACAVVLSPATDLMLTGPSIRYNAEADPMFSPAAGTLLPDLYCPGDSRHHPWISPLFGNWQGLPPLYFIAGSTEMLLDDSVRAHDRAVQAGNEASIDVWPDLPHVFPLFDWLPESRAAMLTIAGFIEDQVSRRSKSAEPVAIEVLRDAGAFVSPPLDLETARRSGL